MRRAPLNGTQSGLGPFPCQRRSHRPRFLEERSSARLRDLPESSQLIERPGFRAARLFWCPPRSWLLLGSWQFCFYNVESSLCWGRGRSGDTSRRGTLKGTAEFDL